VAESINVSNDVKFQNLEKVSDDEASQNLMTFRHYAGNVKRFNVKDLGKPQT
jgi:hypothetical protein